MATRLYGCIVEYEFSRNPKDVTQIKIFEHNEKVLNELPEVDEWPPLTKKMFSITDNSQYLEYGPNYAYGGRIIHFGANFKSIEGEWKEWKSKFENLLTKLLWQDADVHFKTEYTGIQTFTWAIDLKKWSLSQGSEFEIIKREYWDFEGDLSWENIK